MKKQLLSLAIVLSLSTVCFSQANKQKMDQLRKDPKTSENAAKADARLIDEKKIADSAHTNRGTHNTKQAVCKRKKKQKSPSL